ncbi:hypothetical protein ACRRTK_022961 [Alexandromys fortis]
MNLFLVFEKWTFNASTSSLTHINVFVRKETFLASKHFHFFLIFKRKALV